MLVWSRLGVQSFGGGTATLALIRRAVVDELHWITAEEFTTYWALVLMVPGINLLGLTVLIGKQIGGTKGVAIALFGLLFPSVTITILLTALYSKVQHSHSVVSALSGVIPATVGVGLFTSLQIAFPVLKNCTKRGAKSLTIALALLLGSAAIEAAAHWPVVAILLTSGALGAATQFAGAPKRDRQK
jgi:chromate transporter